MAENLAYKPNEGNYRAFGNDQNNVEKYGYLYDYETSKNVCPTGWHLPDKSEFQTLLNFINGCSSTNYKALIEGGTTNFNAQLSGLYTYKFEGKNIETFFCPRHKKQYLQFMVFRFITIADNLKYGQKNPLLLVRLDVLETKNYYRI